MGMHSARYGGLDLKESDKSISFGVPKKKKQTPWPLVRKRTIPTDRPSLVDDI
jgi:hypothetical protein